MNCNQVREAIDTASHSSTRLGAVISHLSGCPECYRYSNETASLIELLSAQPRINVPPDFEFRLRARMARERASIAADSYGFPWRIRPDISSWNRIASFTAAFALIVTASSLFINRYIDRKNEASRGAAISAKTATAFGLGKVSANVQEGAISSNSSYGTSVKYLSHGMKVEKISFQSEDAPEDESETPDGSSATGDKTDDSPRLYSPERKQLLKDHSRFYGAETISVSMAKSPATAPTF